VERVNALGVGYREGAPMSTCSSSPEPQGFTAHCAAGDCHRCPGTVPGPSPALPARLPRRLRGPGDAGQAGARPLRGCRMIAEPGAPMAHATLMMTVSAIRVPVTIATPGPARRDPAGLGGPGRRLRRQRGPGRPERDPGRRGRQAGRGAPGRGDGNGTAGPPRLEVRAGLEGEAPGPARPPGEGSAWLACLLSSSGRSSGAAEAFDPDRRNSPHRFGVARLMLRGTRPGRA
jgi:hypothetical protein